MIERCKLLLRELLKTDTTKIKELETLVGVSKRTISKDLEIIDEIIKINGGNLVRKPSVGIWIEANELVREKLSKIASGNNYKIPNSPKERINYIIVKIIEMDDYITIQDLADEMFVSRSTIEKDLELAEKWLTQRKLKLLKKPNKGIKILGEEKETRATIAELFSEMVDQQDFIKAINAPRIVDDKNKYIDSDLFNLFENDDLLKIEKSVENLEKRIGYQFSDVAFISLMVHIAIAIKRIKQDKEITLSEETIKSLEKYNDEYEAALSMVKELDNNFKLQFPKAEYAYITMHILGSKIQKTFLSEQEFSLDKTSLEKENVDLCMQMIERANVALGINYDNDSQLIKGLSLHIRAAINRLIHKMPIKNPYLEEIKRFYPTAFEAAVMACEVIKEKKHIEINEDEIAYIALHFGAAIERAQYSREDKLKVVIVCSSGIGSSQLVAAKIKRIFDHLDILDVISVTEVSQYILYHNVHLIISTVSIQAQSIPILIVNPFLSPEDIEKIKTFIKNYKNIIYTLDPSSRQLHYLIKKDLIVHLESVKTKEQVLEILSNLLQDNKFVDEGYYDSVLQREKISSTSNQNIAIPHALPGHVLQSAIALCILQSPVDWNGDKVDRIFMLALGEDMQGQLQDVFDEFYELINNIEKMQEIKNMKNVDEIYTFFMGNEA